MFIEQRVPAREIAAGDRIGGFVALTAEHAADHVMTTWDAPRKPPVCFAYGGFVTLDRWTPGMVTCGGCGDPMSEKRLNDRATPVTKGVCSECVAYPVRWRADVERARRIAAYGEGRC